MRSFKDSQNRTWEIAVTAGSIERVKDATGIHLPGLFGDKMKGYIEFLGDAVAQAKVFWALVATKAEIQKVSEEAFKDALDGDAMEAALAALQEELIDFFPKAQREPLRKTLAKLKTIGEAALAMGTEKLDALGDAEIAAFLKTLDEKLTASSGGAPASSESTPVPSPSAS